MRLCRCVKDRGKMAGWWHRQVQVMFPHLFTLLADSLPCCPLTRPLARPPTCRPQPMFLMSAPGNKVWLHVLERIKRVWKDLDAWHSTGPAGLNTALLEYVHTHGTGALVPWVTHRSEPEFLEFAKAAGKNGSVPWYPLAQKQVGMPTGECGAWGGGGA